MKVKITIQYNDSYTVTLEIPDQEEPGLYDVQDTALKHVLKLADPYALELEMHPPYDTR